MRASRFGPPSGVQEIHLCVMPGEPGGFSRRLGDLEEAHDRALERLGLTPATAVFRRFFLSDSANQEAELLDSPLGRPDPKNPVAVSIVEQPPLPEGRIALWAYHLSDPEGPLVKERREGAVLIRRGRVSHLWTTDPGGPGAPGPPDPRAQTRASFAALKDLLGRHGATLLDHVIRTWIFVQLCEINYDGMAEERRRIFTEEGLTDETHYIASTGITGRRADPRRIVSVEGYALPGIRPEQIRFLSAPDRLGPTSRYGVTFERGVRIDHGDRRHLLISGTASIDPDGNVVHLRDIAGQLRRTFHNLEGLLEDGDADLNDLAQMIIYLRDPGDRAPVARYLEERLPDVPFILVKAPVCRPGWLVEVEGWAVLEGGDPRWGRL